MRRSQRLGAMALVLCLVILFAGGPLVRTEARVPPLLEAHLAGNVCLVNWYEGSSADLPYAGPQFAVH